MTLGTIRELGALEKALNQPFQYVVEDAFCCWLDNGMTIRIPRGFLTDGSSGGPDWGWSWLIHDYLYAAHPCTRKDADDIMCAVLQYERHFGYKWLFKAALWINPLWAFSRAWKNSGQRGVTLLEEDDDN